jgi:hypothetical protein
MWITWGTGTAHLLPRLIAGRECCPLFLSECRAGPHRRYVKPGLAAVHQAVQTLSSPRHRR